MASQESHIHWDGSNDQIVTFLGQDIRIQLNENPEDPIGALHIHADGFAGTPLFLPNSTPQTPTWDPIPGTSPVLEVRQDGFYPQDFIRVRAAGSTPVTGTSVAVVASPIITSGTITCGTATPTQIGPDLVIPAEPGDNIELAVRALCPDLGGPLYWNAAIRVGGVDVSYFGNGTSSWPHPQGAISGFYTHSGSFTGPRGTAMYVVQPGDISGGTVTVRVYAQAEASSRDVLASAGQPLQTRLVNYRQ